MPQVHLLLANDCQIALGSDYLKEWSTRLQTRNLILMRRFKMKKMNGYFVFCLQIVHAKHNHMVNEDFHNC